MELFLAFIIWYLIGILASAYIVLVDYRLLALEFRKSLDSPNDYYDGYYSSFYKYNTPHLTDIMALSLAGLFVAGYAVYVWHETKGTL